MPNSPHRAIRPLALLAALTLAGGIVAAADARDGYAAVRTEQAAPVTAPPVLDAPPTGAEPAPAPTTTAAPEAPVVAVSAPAAPVRAAVPTPAAPAPTTTAAPAPAAVRAPAPATTAPPAPTTTAAPAPRPEPAPAPPPAPARQPSREERVAAAFAGAVPGSWREAVPARFEITEGTYSWAHTSGLIQIAAVHADGDPRLLADIVAHEFGHLIAFRYGSQAYAGAPPEGWPAPSHRPEEAWADCVQRAFTGRTSSTHGQAPCDGEPLRWASQWLAAGPGAHPRTR